MVLATIVPVSIHTTCPGRHQRKTLKIGFVMEQIGESQKLPPDQSDSEGPHRGRTTRRGRTSLSAKDPRHGTENGYNNFACRCTKCKQAHAAYAYNEQQQRRGSLQPGDRRHGTYNGYRNYGCRCAECKAAHLEYARDYARRTGR